MSRNGNGGNSGSGNSGNGGNSGGHQPTAYERALGAAFGGDPSASVSMAGAGPNGETKFYGGADRAAGRPMGDGSGRK